jgi:hypothetical protein
MPYTYSHHARQRMQERGITEANIEWAIGGGSSRAIEEGKTLHQRWWTDSDGDRWGLFVISDDDHIVTTWIREG